MRIIHDLYARLILWLLSPSLPEPLLQYEKDRVAFGAVHVPFPFDYERIEKRGKGQEKGSDLKHRLKKFASEQGMHYRKYGEIHWLYGEQGQGEWIYRIDVNQRQIEVMYTHFDPAWLLQDNPCSEPLAQHLTVEDINNVFKSGLKNPLSEPIQFEAAGRKFYYVKSDFVGYIDKAFLLELADTITSFAYNFSKCYGHILDIGGEASRALSEIAFSNGHKLQSVAIQLLYDIGQQTTQELKDEAEHLFCVYCLTKCDAHQVQLPQLYSVTYYGCRVCSQSKKFLEIKGRVTAVLDEDMKAEQVQAGDSLRVNWLLRRNLFDFDAVEIIQATDEDVERFAVQIGNDTDEIRCKSYEQVRCVVSSGCNLSENTLRILQRMLGEIAYSPPLSTHEA